MPDGIKRAEKSWVVIPGAGEEFHVKGFAKAHEDFMQANPTARPRLSILALLLILIGGLAAVNGLLILMMGYKYIVVDLSYGLYDFYYVRIHFFFVLAPGLSVLLVGMALFKEGAGISAERFLAEEYEVLGDEGVLSESAYSLQYLGESQFLVKRRLHGEASNNPSAPESS